MAKRARINRGSHPEESNLCVENKVNSIGGNGSRGQMRIYYPRGVSVFPGRWRASSSRGQLCLSPIFPSRQNPVRLSALLPSTETKINDIPAKLPIFSTALSLFSGRGLTAIKHPTTFLLSRQRASRPEFLAAYSFAYESPPFRRNLVGIFNKRGCWPMFCHVSCVLLSIVLEYDTRNGDSNGAGLVRDEAGKADGAFSALFFVFFATRDDPVPPSYLSSSSFLPPLEGNSFRS